jgi:hypothetical protein
VKEASILIVVGRQDTGELEAQIRGSRHAWDIRLISAEALIKLVKLKENSEDPETGRKIRNVLVPVEYTRLDSLVDVVFTAAIDVFPSMDEPKENDEEIAQSDVRSDGEASAKSTPDVPSSGVWEFTDPALLQQKRADIIKTMSSLVGSALIKKSRALYWSSDHSKRLACTISKKYTKAGAYPYWYAFHPQWRAFLNGGDQGFLVLGCMDRLIAFAIPRDVIEGILPNLNTTKTARGKYWHIHLAQNSKGDLEILLPKADSTLPISSYMRELV